jgi:hypothetical protein
MITERGRLAWQKATDYGRRSLVKTTLGRYKALIGPRLRARGFDAQQTEATIGVALLNRMLRGRAPGFRPQDPGHWHSGMAPGSFLAQPRKCTNAPASCSSMS